jgi:pSer/pThr/pTyr-binding forkhead associated (FHA) protein
VVVEDLNSYNGVKVNGDRIQGNYEIKQGDLVQIGDYDLAIQAEDGELMAAAPAPAPRAAAPAPAEAEDDLSSADEPTTPTEAAAFSPPAAAPAKRQESTAIISSDKLRAEHEAANKKVVDIPAEKAPRLVLTTTDLAGREYACIRSELKIGRGEDNDISIDHRSLSRNHCKLALVGGSEWKVIDLQSANGIKVNGEQYAECALRPGDALELGHLKFKFLAAGEELPPSVPDDEKTPLPDKTEVRGKNKMPMFIGIGAGALVLLGIGGFLMTRGGDEKPQPPPAVPVGGTKPPSPDKTASGGDEPVKPQPKPPEPAAEEPDPKAVKAFEAGKQLLADGKYEDAEKKLAAAKEGGVADADEYLAKARAEIEARSHLAAAQKLVQAKDYESAKLELEAIAEGTGVAAKVKDLSRQIAQAEEKSASDRAAADKAAEDKAAREAKAAEDKAARETKAAEDKAAREAKAAEDKAAREAKAAAAAAKAAEAKAAAAAKAAEKKVEPTKANGQAAADFATGKNLASNSVKKYKQAIPHFEKALSEDPSLVEAHMYLGLCYASIENITKGAFHYEEFAHLAPNHAKAPEVRRILRQYYSESGAKPRYPLPDD